MTTPLPIAFEPAGKPSPTRRDAGSGQEGQSFADTMQTQRVADRATAATDKAAERTASAHKHAQAQSDAKAGTPAVDRPAANGAQEGAAQGGKSGAANADKAAASAQPHGKADEKAAQAATRAAEQGASKAAQTTGNAAQADGKAASASAGANGANTKAAAATPAQAATQAATQANTGAAAAARGKTIDGQPVKAIVQDARPGHARPVHAATAVAAQTATTSTTASGKNGGDAKATQGTATAASTSKLAAKGATNGDHPTAQTLKEAFAGQREAGTSRRDPESTEANAQRHETRPTGQRAAGGGMSPALRAAAEAVQQQLSGNGTGTTAGNPGTGASQTGGQSAQQILRADAAAPQAAGSGQTFDPVLQNTGPQPGGAGQPGSLAAAGKTAPTAGTGAGNPAPTTPPAEQVAVQIQRAAAQGHSRVQIRLNPAELGRIDVKLEVGDDGHVRAALAVDKPDTLDMMQRDPRALERALQAAGLKTDQGSLSFNLRDDGNGTGQQGAEDDRDTPAGGSVAQAPGDTQIPAEPLRASLPADGGVDIRV